MLSGIYPNLSQFVRIKMSAIFESGDVPSDSLPFGFRGLQQVKTNNTLTDSTNTALPGADAESLPQRLAFVYAHGTQDYSSVHSGSIVPPVPYRFKATRGKVDSSGTKYIGQIGKDEIADSRYYWGVKTTRVPLTSSMSDSVLNANASDVINPLVETYTKFLGIEKLDALVTGSGADRFNNNKFTLARVALFKCSYHNISNRIDRCC